MKVEYAQTNVLGSEGLGAAQTFQIKTNAHAFKILSSGLYSDKIGAVLREIGCNAHDAHISVGKSHLPFEVKLPNGIDDQFWIKDFGPGLSYEDVMSLYTTYFASTKQQSDDFTGGFGLGSKSPFSYTNSFMIESCHGGKRRIFTAHIDNKGSPIIAMMSETDATDTGIKISFPVASSDFRTFQNKAQEKFQYFNPLPIVIGGDDIRPPKSLEQTSEYIIHETGDLGALVGNVWYPVDINQLRSPLFTVFSYRDAFTVKLPIGSVSVSANRESLEYTPETIKALTVALERVVRDICMKMADTARKIATWNDRCDFYSQHTNLSKGLSITATTFSTLGITDGPYIMQICSGRYAETSVPYKAEVVAARYVLNNNKMDKTTPRQHDRALLIPLVKNTVIVKGNATVSSQRIRDALLTGKYEQIIGVYNTPGKLAADADIDAIVAEIVKATGSIDVIDIATLDRPVPISKGKSAKAVSVFDGDVYLQYDQLNTPTKSSVSPRHNYVRVSKNANWGNIRPIYYVGDKALGGYYEWREFEQHLRVLEAKGIIEAPVFMTAATVLRMKLEDNPVWKPYDVYLRTVLLDSDVIDGLKKRVSRHIQKIDLDSEGVNSPLGILVNLKNKFPDIYDTVKSKLTAHGAAKEIEKVHAFSRDESKQENENSQELVTAYRFVVRMIGGGNTDTLPELNKAESAVNAHFRGRFDGIDFHLVNKLASISPRACTTLITDVISKGTT